MGVSRFPVRAIGLLAMLFFGLMQAQAQAGYAHFIMDASTGEVLASQNADVINHPASLTKMMTLYMTFEALHSGRLSWNQKITMTRNAAGKIPFKLGVRAGNTLTVREAVLGMAIRSANDAAAAMGDHLGGNEAAFGALMTRKARALGMTKTVFRNASGLPDKRQVTTARDMAILAHALIRDFPKEYKLFSMRSFEFRGKRVRGHNNLMYRYPGMDGVKTGFINASGFNIASAVHVKGRRVIGVVMGGRTARSRDNQMAALLDRYVASAKVAKAGGAIAASKVAKLASSDVPLPEPAPRMMQPVEVASAGLSVDDILAATAGEGMPSWRIQVAAADSRRGATSILSRAQNALAGRFGEVELQVEAYSGSARPLYRARIAGFDSQEGALNACKLLHGKHFECFVVPQSG